ncbi:helix-turn-helix domain-containing protein [Sphaerotilus montanus]|jgi:transcriptional regulator with XRE-family HTH domain|uniref:helix-turn-helix domain-containing protein n=1 Tax=Sphaerotilus montanus TaxID=522889 RepID=UPI003FA22158
MIKSIHTRHNDIFLGMLRRSREAQRLRQADLAIRLGRGQATISKVERGERRLDVIELRAWLHALEIDFADFMSELNHRLEGMPIPDAMFRARRTTRIRQGDRS